MANVKSRLVCQRQAVGNDAHHAPSRLVAAPLEAAWNGRLRELEEALSEREQRRRERGEEMSAEQPRSMQDLAEDFAQVWNAPATQNVDRKRLLGQLAEDVTLLREGWEVSVGLRLRGGKVLQLEPVAQNKPATEKFRLCPETVAALDLALEHSGDAKCAEILKAAGHRYWGGRPLTVQSIYYLRQRAGLPDRVERRRAALRERGKLTAAELLGQLGVSPSKVHNRAQRGPSCTKRSGQAGCLRRCTNCRTLHALGAAEMSSVASHGKPPRTGSADPSTLFKGPRGTYHETTVEGRCVTECFQQDGADKVAMPTTGSPTPARWDGSGCEASQISFLQPIHIGKLGAVVHQA